MLGNIEWNPFFVNGVLNFARRVLSRNVCQFLF